MKIAQISFIYIITTSASVLAHNLRGVKGLDTNGNDNSLDVDDENPPLRKNVLPLDNYPVIKLSTAQNALNYDFFAEEFFNKMLPPLGPMETVKYSQPAHGTKKLRTLVAGMLSNVFRVEVDPDLLYGTAGVTAALDSLNRILQNDSGENNDAIIASPYWPGFRWATEEYKTGHLHAFHPQDQYTMQLTVNDIKTAMQSNPTARILYMCNPHNPLGVIYDKQNLEDIYSYILHNYPDMHIISDEMYAHSILPEHKDKYVGALALDAYQKATKEQRQHVHVVWGFAKDFGFNGWKVGFIHSTNPQVREAFIPTNPTFTDLAFLSTPISALTDYYMVEFMSANATSGEKVWAEGMNRYPIELDHSYDLVKSHLNNVAVSYFEHNYGGQFFWVNLTTTAQGVGGEENLEALLESNGLALEGGKNFDAPIEGFYRLCYTCASFDVLDRGLNILTDTIASVAGTDHSQRRLQSHQ